MSLYRCLKNPTWPPLKRYLRRKPVHQAVSPLGHVINDCPARTMKDFILHCDPLESRVKQFLESRIHTALIRVNPCNPWQKNSCFGSMLTSPIHLLPQSAVQTLQNPLVFCQVPAQLHWKDFHFCRRVLL